jgi:hypothetical protein
MTGWVGPRDPGGEAPYPEGHLKQHHGQYYWKL